MACSDMQLRLGARARNNNCILSHIACITLRADILVARSDSQRRPTFCDAILIGNAGAVSFCTFRGAPKRNVNN
jgi:hypothetical protein